MKVRTKSKKVNKAWLHDHANDPYVKRAQQEGYRARAAYKLAEIDDALGLIKPGQVVVDLGAVPGAWSQVVRRRLAPGGAAAGALPGTLIALVTSALVSASAGRWSMAAVAPSPLSITSQMPL